MCVFLAVIHPREGRGGGRTERWRRGGRETDRQTEKREMGSENRKVEERGERERERQTEKREMEREREVR